MQFLITIIKIFYNIKKITIKISHRFFYSFIVRNQPSIYKPRIYRHLHIFVDVEFRFIYYVLIIIKIRVSIVGTENRKYADSLFRFISIHRYTHLLRQEIPIAHEWCTCNQATDNQESGHCARGYRFSSSLSSSPAGYHAFSRSSEILSPTKSGNWARVDV